MHGALFDLNTIVFELQLNKCTNGMIFAPEVETLISADGVFKIQNFTNGSIAKEQSAEPFLNLSYSNRLAFFCKAQEHGELGVRP